MKRRLSAILRALKTAGFSASTSFGNYELTHVKTGTTVMEFRMESRDMRYCCGVLEVGDVVLDITSSKYTPSVTVQKLFIQHIFLTLKAREDKGNTYKGKRMYRPVVFCGNGSGDCIIIEKALRALKQDYKLVSKQDNPNSFNTISMFVSK
jgi:hypothetical protein